MFHNTLRLVHLSNMTRPKPALDMANSVHTLGTAPASAPAGTTFAVRSETLEREPREVCSSMVNGLGGSS